MSLVVAAFGHGLVMAAPPGPRQHVLDRWKRPPHHTPEQASDFGDSEGDERDQLGDGDGSRPAQGRFLRPACAWRWRRKVAILPRRPRWVGLGNTACWGSPF